MTRLALIAILALALRSDASNMFLHLDGVPGESRSARHAGWIELHNVSFGVEKSPSSPAAFSPLTMVKSLDKASPKLFSLASSGQVLPSAVLDVLRADSSSIRLLQLKLGQVSVARFQQFGASPETPLESVALNFATVRWSYTQVGADGKPLRDITCSWNLATATGNAGAVPSDTDDDGLPDDYEKLYGLNPDLADAHGDLDNDGMTNIEEFRAGTIPNRADSIFRLSGSRTESGAAALNWQPARGKTYRLMGAASPDQPFQFIRFLTEAEAAAGQLQLQTTSNFAFFILEAE